MKKELYSWKELSLNDAFERTVVNIHLRRQEKGRKTFVFCGCSPKVGTTAISINLAISMAKSGWKTVLIDADLRKNREDKRLSEDKRHLADYLSGGADVRDILCETNHHNLFYISGGDPAQNPIQLLCSSRMQELFAYLKTEFDYIMIDAPPPGEIVDTCLLARQADDIVLVALWNGTTVEQINATQADLASSGASIMGVIVNRMDKSFYHHYCMGRRHDKKAAGNKRAGKKDVQNENKADA